MNVRANNTINNERIELRKFGVTVGIVMILLGVLFLWREKEWYFYLPVVATFFLFLGLFRPFLLKPIYKIWMILAILIGWFVTRIIIIILFYLVVTPIGLLARLSAKDFLKTKFNRNANSYWIPRKAIKFDKIKYENQF